MNYSRANGDTHFQDESASGNPVASVDIDTELTALKTEINKGFPKDCSEAITGTFTTLKGSDVASPAGGALALTAGNYFDITGTNAITSINTLGIGTEVTLHFDGILTLTHDATNLILPGGMNITTYTGLEVTLIEYASGDWRLVSTSDIPSGMIDRQVSEVQVVSSDTETNLYSYTVPAGLLSTNRGLRMKTIISQFNNSGGACNFTYKGYYGTTVIATTGARAVGVSALEDGVLMELDLFANNATGAQVAKGLHGVFDSAVNASAKGYLFKDKDDALFGCVHNAVAEDSTGALPFKLTLEMSVNSANAWVKCHNGTVELI